MHCVTARIACADALYAVGEQQTAIQKALIAAWRWPPGTSTWSSTLVCALHTLFRPCTSRHARSLDLSKMALGANHHPANGRHLHTASRCS